jgi:hypothetical protein
MRLTFPVIMQIQQLVAPLCQDSQGILEERDDDQESANGWQVSTG